VWEYASGYSYTGQDNTLGACWVAYYEKPGTEWRSECCFFVTPTEVHPEDARYGTFAVEERWEIWREVDGEQDDWDMGYEFGSALCYSTVEQAEEDAKRIALLDQSHTYNV
jgi:hypothetical protein